jgi:AAA ATPase domain
MAPASVPLSGGSPVLLLEREVQVAALQVLIEAARSGGGRFAVIEGSAGIGKTRLLVEARAIAGSAGMRVLSARGGELEGEFAYGSVRQLFEPLLASVAPDVRAELLSGRGLSLPTRPGQRRRSAPGPIAGRALAGCTPGRGFECASGPCPMAHSRGGAPIVTG